MAILNYTTTVSVERSCQEIYQILAKHKATAIMSEYDDSGIIEAIAFRLNTPQGIIHYKLPANVAGVARKFWLALDEKYRALCSCQDEKTIVEGDYRYSIKNDAR